MAAKICPAGWEPSEKGGFLRPVSPAQGRVTAGSWALSNCPAFPQHVPRTCCLCPALTREGAAAQTRPHSLQTAVQATSPHLFSWGRTKGLSGPGDTEARRSVRTELGDGLPADWKALKSCVPRR